MKNPSVGYAREADTASYDNNYPDPTPNSLGDNLWTTYEAYTNKFLLAVYDDANTANSGNIAY